MEKVDSTVLNETKYISGFVLLLSVVLQAVALIIGKWDYTVLLGNLLSGVAGILNFFVMGITVQRALGKDEQGAKAAMKASQAYRTLFLAVILVIGFTVSYFNNLAVVVPLFFPRIAVAFRPLFDKRK